MILALVKQAVQLCKQGLVNFKYLIQCIVVEITGGCGRCCSVVIALSFGVCFFLQGKICVQRQCLIQHYH